VPKRETMVHRTVLVICFIIQTITNTNVFSTVGDRGSIAKLTNMFHISKPTLSKIDFIVS